MRLFSIIRWIAIIGGNTGSGKTVLLRCLLWQAIQQSDIVYIADFKGGVDFGRLWHRFAHIITNEKDLPCPLADGRVLSSVGAIAVFPQCY